MGRVLFEDCAGAVFLFSALDGRTLRVPGVTGPLAAALWDADDCNCAALVAGDRNCAALVAGDRNCTALVAGGARALPAGACRSVHVIVYTPSGLGGPGEPAWRPLSWSGSAVNS